MLKAKIISSLDKVFLDSEYAAFAQVKGMTVFENQRISLQILVCDFDSNVPHRRFAPLSCSGIAPEAVTFRMVDLVPSWMPVYPGRYDEGYVRTAPGLYPDLLSPMQMGCSVPVVNRQCRTVWVDIDLSVLSKDQIKAGDNKLTFVLADSLGIVELPFVVQVIAECLPEVDF